MENELENNQKNNNYINNLDKNIEKEQKGFIGKLLGGAVDTAMDTAIRVLLPDMLEEGVINIKDVLIKEGLKEGIKAVGESATNLGKSVLGIVTGNFENISQAYNAIKKGGIIDGISSVIDDTLKSAKKDGYISNDIANLLKKGKNVIKECVSSNIEKTFMEQVDSIEKIGKYINNWNKYLNIKDYEGMEREYKKIENRIKNILPLEKTLQEVEVINNMHTLIKNKGGIENLTNMEIELAKKIV